jgi:Protein of unknown function (DUF3102)
VNTTPELPITSAHGETSGPPETPEPSLDELRAAIEHEHACAIEAYRDAVLHAIRAGDLLLQAKARVGHGGWLPWLADNFPASTRTAQGYMRLARHREDAQRLAHLGIAQALRALRCGELSAHDAREVARELRLDEEWQAFAQCATALGEIRDRALYRRTTYGTFGIYVNRRWNLAPPATKQYLALAEDYLEHHGADGNRSLSDCEAIIETRRMAFAYVGGWLDARQRASAGPRQMRGQLPLYGPPPVIPCAGRKPPIVCIPDPRPTPWEARRTSLVQQAIAEALDVGELTEATVANAEPHERPFLLRDRPLLITQVQLHVNLAARFSPSYRRFWWPGEEGP